MTATSTILNKSSHLHFAGRRPAGTDHPVTLGKRGVWHTQRLPDGSERTVLACGLACSEVFSGPRLAKVLKEGLQLELKCMEELMRNDSAVPLSIHTSSGVTEQLTPFLQTLETHLPFTSDDWCASLQLEGASAVWAAIDLVLQVNLLEDPHKYQERTKVAVGATSYHGPPSTSVGAKSPLWRKPHQLIYPVPTAYGTYDKGELLTKYRQFLEDHAHELGAILFEPQWGSSQAALPWPRDLLTEYIRMAREDYGLKIICDEIMCGLGRHGHQGTLFVSKAWNLDPDCVTFGKAVATGLFPLSGAILKKGRTLLQTNKCSVLQSHTYAGSSARALMTATAVLQELPQWLPSVTHLGEELSHIMRYLTDRSQGMFVCHGQGLMWGGIVTHDGQNEDPDFRARVVHNFKQNCEEAHIIPYFVPVGGFMVSPVVDIDVATIYEIGERLERAIVQTMNQVDWKPVVKDALATPNSKTSGHRRTPSAIASASSLNLTQLEAASSEQAASRPHIMVPDLGNDKCVPYLHATKCCTACGSFVKPNVRTKFVGSTASDATMCSEVLKTTAPFIVYDQFGETEDSDDNKTEPSTTTISVGSAEGDSLSF